MPSNHRLIHHTKPRHSLNCSEGITGSWDGSISTLIISPGVLLIWSLCSSWLWLCQQPWLVRKGSLWLMLSAREHVELQHQKMPNVCSLPYHPSPDLSIQHKGVKYLRKGTVIGERKTDKQAPKEQPQGRILKGNLFSSQDPSTLSAAGLIYIIQFRF